jgi:hypothetical protein
VGPLEDVQGLGLIQESDGVVDMAVARGVDGVRVGQPAS